MSGVIGTIVAAVETCVTALGYTLSDNVFNFDCVPDSVIDKSYFIEIKQNKATYFSGHKKEAVDEMMVWLAFKKDRDPHATRNVAIDARETLESGIMNNAALLALPSDPIITMDGEASLTKEFDDYLMMKLVFFIDYLRSVAP
jgi:hypothetical protein